MTALNAPPHRDMSNATARFWAGVALQLGVGALAPYHLPVWGAVAVIVIGAALLLSSRGEA